MNGGTLCVDSNYINFKISSLIQCVIRTSRVRNEPAMRSPRLLSEQREGAAGVHGSERNNSLSAPDVDKGGSGRGVEGAGGLQSRACHKTVH